MDPSVERLTRDRKTSDSIASLFLAEAQELFRFLMSKKQQIVIDNMLCKFKSDHEIRSQLFC
jgi:hypothetical protein